MNKKTAVSVMVVLILLTISLYFVGGTYARYIDTFNGEATAKIAKWSVKLNGEDSSSATFTDLEWKIDENEYVAEGVVAPDSSMSAELTIDLTGTQVAVDIFGKVNTESLASIIGDSKIEVTMTVDGKAISESADDTTPTIGVSEISGDHKIKITVAWDNDEDKHNAKDTELGKAATSLTLPLELTVQQHIKTT